ncbi:MAG: hypothetical protein RLZZ628_3976 [Bacteroidota bacterium]|jgi:hypothetical protein
MNKIYILFTVLFSLIGEQQVRAQPVKIEITNPFSTKYLSDYDHSVQLQLEPGKFNIPIPNLQLEWNISMAIGNDSFKIKCDANNFTPFTLFTTKTLRVIDFINASRPTHNLPEDLVRQIMVGGILPEGSYTFCVTAYQKNQRVSDLACSFIEVLAFKPPVLNETLCEQKSIPILPHLFTWSNESSNMRRSRFEYVFYMAKQEGNLDIQETMKHAVENQTAFIKTGLNRESYLLKTTDFPLVAGETYVWMVQMRVLNFDYQSLFIEQEGKSEVCSFVFAPPKPNETKILGRLDSEGDRYDPDYLFVEYYADVQELQKDSLRRKYGVDSFEVFRNINPTWEGWHITQDAEKLLEILRLNERGKLKYAGLNYWGGLNDGSSASHKPMDPVVQPFPPLLEVPTEKELRVGILDGFAPDIQSNGLKTYYYSVIQETPNKDASEHAQNVYTNFTTSIKKLPAKNIVVHQFQVCKATGEGQLDYRHVLKGINSCAALKVEIINLSLGFKHNNDTDIDIDTFKEQFVKKAMQYKDSIVFVCAAGNDTLDLDSPNTIKTYPACWSKDYVNVISVAALKHEKRYKTSNYGKKNITIAAEAVSAAIGTNDEFATSFATPVVTAIIAQEMLLYQKTARNIKKALKEKTEPSTRGEETVLGHLIYNNK